MLWLPGKVNRRIQLPVPLYYEALTGTGRFDISGLPQGFFALEIILIARSSVAAAGDSVYMYFNGDTTAANYRTGRQLAGTGPTNTATDAPDLDTIPAANSTANDFGHQRIYIPEYAGSKRKSASYLGGQRRDATVIYTTTGLINWENTAAITQVTIQPDGYATDTFVAGSTIQIIGRYHL